MDSEISGLLDKHAFLKLGNYVARLSFTYCHVQPNAPAFEPRAVEDDELDFDPVTLRSRRTTSLLQDSVTHIPGSATFAEDPKPLASGEQTGSLSESDLPKSPSAEEAAPSSGANCESSGRTHKKTDARGKAATQKASSRKTARKERKSDRPKQSHLVSVGVADTTESSAHTTESVTPNQSSAEI
jgi:hypothetical protein